MGKTDKRKILFVSHSSALTGGGEDDFERLLVFFSKTESIEVYGLFPFGPRASKYSQYCAGYKLYRASWFPFSYNGILSYMKFLYYTVIQFSQVYGFISRNDFDVCVFNVGALPQLNLLMWIHRKKQFIIIRETLKPVFFRKILYKFYNFIASEILTVSYHNTKDFIASTKSRKTVTTILSSVELYDKAGLIRDPELESLFGNDIVKKLNDKNLFKILQIGNISKLKNQILSLKAVNLLKNKYKAGSSVVLFFIGDADVEESYTEFLNAFILQNNLNEQVLFLGRQLKDVTFTILNKVDFLMISSFNEGLPLVIPEAFQFGRPVISTNNGGPIDVINDDYNGFIIDFDEESAARAIIKLCNREKLNILSQNAFNSFEKIFNLNKNLEKIEELIRLY